MWQKQSTSRAFPTGKVDNISFKKHHSMTGCLPGIMVLKDRFERFAIHSSGFARGH